MENRMNYLEMTAMELGLSISEAAFELVTAYYEAAGLDSEILRGELSSKSDEEIIEMDMKL